MRNKSIKRIGQVLFVFALVFVLLNVVVSTGMMMSMENNQTGAALLVDGSGEVPTSGEVTTLNFSTTSLEDAVHFTGASDSHVSATVNEDIDGDWSFCTWAKADADVVSNNESREIAGYQDRALAYNGTTDEYVAWYYDDGSRDSYRATVNAPSPASNTLVCAIEEGNSLTVYQNTTGGDSVATDVDNIAPAPTYENWKGELDETRLYNESLNTTQQNQLYSEPVLSVDGTSPSARLMYDVRDRSTSTVPVYFSGTTATLSNATFVDGFDAVPVAEGTDFMLSGGNNQIITPTDSGVLNGQGDVLFLTFTSQELMFLGQVIQIGQAALQVALLAVLVAAVAFAYRQFDKF